MRGWETKSLGDISAINYGYTESATDNPIGPRFLRITDIQDEKVNWDTVPYCKIDPSDLGKYSLATGDIVFARTGATTGKSFLVNKPPTAVFASYLIRLRLIDKNLLPEFVSYFFQTAGYWKSIKEGSSGSAQGGFNATKLGALTIPMPLLSEQQQIVTTLDKAFSAIATATDNAEKNLQNARELFESSLQAVFSERGEGWEESALEDYIRFIDYRGRTPKKTEQGMRLITAKNVKKGFLQLEPREYVNPDIYDEWMTRGFPKKGDVLFTTEAPLGHVAQLDTDGKVVFAQRIIILQPDREVIDPTFLKYLLLSKSMQKELHEHGTGATAKGIKAKLLKKIRIRYPALVVEQKKLVDKLESLESECKRLVLIYQSKLEELQTLKQSLLKKAFSGDLP